MKFARVDYSKLNARQQEAYNFHKFAAVLADYGFCSIRLSDDWQGADFIAQHVDGVTFLKVQLKGRLCFDRKYEGKDLWVAFCSQDHWYLYPHDSLLAELASAGHIVGTDVWRREGIYHFPSISKKILVSLEKYRLG